MRAAADSVLKIAPIARTSAMTTVYDIPLQKIDGAPASLADYRGKVLLIVNVASKCGLTPQYENLEKLYEDKREQGLVVLGFPANNFGAQEPGANDEIAAFCTTNFGVQFPMFEKISVKGDDQHPLYAALTAAQPKSLGDEPFRERLSGYGIAVQDNADVLWNFEKFLVGRDGAVVGRFAPTMTSEDPQLAEAIDAELAKA
jgi:glutathione peroxidase